MSNNIRGSGNEHLYGFSDRLSQDKHIQNIIAHTRILFPEHDFEDPYYTSPDVTEAPGNSEYLNSVGEEQPAQDQQLIDDQQLDEFDRQVLGRPFASDYAPRLANSSPRISLPNTNVSNIQQPRILGDASHHFKPFVPQGAQPRPYFTSPININQLDPIPATRPICKRDGSQDISNIHPGRHLVTSPFCTADRHRVTPLNSIQSSPSELGGSSPTARLSRRRENVAMAKPPPSPQQASKRVKLNLDHAPTDLTPNVSGTDLVNPRKALPDKCRAVFPYELFNVVQSVSFPLVYGSNNNVVISAPTGSGKTVILEMAICKLVTTTGGENFKIVYQAPTKSLCSERARDWDKKFSHLGLRCVELTGDTSQAETNRVGGASIIVTTPEKWDSITRKWADHRKLLEMIRLVLIDEVHILKDARGATLEAVVSRMKTSGANVRFVALSATIPNISDIAAWLGRDHANQEEPAKSASFGEEFRPVKLKKYVYGYDSTGNDFIFEKSLNSKLDLLLTKHKSGKPIMVFCFTRKSCEQTARYLTEWWLALRADDKPWPAATQHIPAVSRELQEIVRYGVAFHHAGLDVQDKSLVESHFSNGQLHVICCTSTLAVGINLPCHTVILKGTVSWTDNGPQEYSDLEVMQMLGRAGRPQFDRNAVAIIMTKRVNSSRYEKMVSGEEVLESKLHLNLIEHLNSEIGLGTIQTLKNAKKWIAGTFLNVRMRQAPEKYQSEMPHAEGAPLPDQSPESRIQSWCERDIKLLRQHRLITSEDRFSCTEYGKAMSRYMVQFETMKMLLSIPKATNLKELLTYLSKAVEFKDLRAKSIEKAVFRNMNLSVLYSVKENISETWHKIYLLVQMHLGCLELPTDKDSGIFKRQVIFDQKLILDRMNRLVRCVIDCKVFDGDSVGVKAALELARAFGADSWEGHSTQLQQIPGIGPVAMRKLVSHDIHTVLDLSNRDFEEIERIMSRNPPFGKALLRTLDGFPRLRMTAVITNSPETPRISNSPVTVTIKVNLSYSNAKLPSWKGKHPIVTLLVDTTDGKLAYFWRSNIRKIDRTSGLDLIIPVVISGVAEKISCYYSCEEIVGTQVVEVLSPSVPSSAFYINETRRSTKVLPQTQQSDFDFDFEDNGGLDDNDMIAMDLADDSVYDSVQPNIASQSEDLVPEFPDIEDVLHVQNEEPASVPVQMDNGKWMCNHHCRGGGLTKNGKRCIHKCCHEGVDKPRPPPRKKMAEAAAGNESAMKDHSSNLNKGIDHRNKSVGSNLSRHRQDVKNGSNVSKSTTLSPTSYHDESHGRKRFVTEPNDFVGTKNILNRRSSSSPKKMGDMRITKKLRPNNRHDDIVEEKGCVKLCVTANGDELELFETARSNQSTLGAKDERNISTRRSRDQGRDALPYQLTKSYNSTNSDVNPSDFSAKGNVENLGGSHYGSDDEDFPEINDLVQLVDETHEAELSQGWMNDGALYPGCLNANKEHKNDDQEPDLSSTTLFESEKMLPGFDPKQLEERSSKAAKLSLPSSDLQSEQNGTPVSSSSKSFVDRSTLNDASLQQEDAEGARDPLFINPDIFQVAVNVDQNTQFESISPTKEPAWLSEIDPEIVDMVRGYVDFID